MIILAVMAGTFAAHLLWAIGREEILFRLERRALRNRLNAMGDSMLRIVESWEDL